MKMIFIGTDKRLKTGESYEVKCIGNYNRGWGKPKGLCIRVEGYGRLPYDTLEGFMMNWRKDDNC